MRTEEQATATIRVAERPACMLCGEPGSIMHAGLEDRLFGVPGSWSLRQCPRSDCKMAWLDPMPLEEDLHLAYDRYYTHSGSTSVEGGNSAVSAAAAPGILQRLFRVANRLSGQAARRTERDLAYLTDVSPGRLLEVGCGDGSRLAQLRALGWQVQGQDVDPQAALAARERYGLSVHVGKLEDAGFGDAAFDAVVMNHVIEHAARPGDLLTDCHRLLRLGGTLTVLTPNVLGLWHARFGDAWRGLEPPRHLHLFSLPALQTLATRAGFVDTQCWTTSVAARGALEESLELRAGARSKEGLRPRPRTKLRALLLQAWADLRFRSNSGIGEECVLRARR